jgi:rod shape-determining protein MreB
MHIAIDLGTSRFHAGYVNQKKYISEPNVVARDHSGKCIIGTKAEQMVGKNPDIIHVWHPIENGIIKDVEGTVEVIKYVLKSMRSTRLKTRCQLTISVPTGLTQVEKRALIEAGQQAGARKVELFESAIAAAIGAGLPIGTPTGSFIVNLGAGVTEVSLLSMGGIVDSRQMRIGGRTIDYWIMDMVRKEYHFAIGLRTAERVKMQCMGEFDKDEFEVYGKNLATGLPDKKLISREQIEQQLETYYTSIVNLIIQTIESCPPELVGDITEHGIVLVGGGACAKSVLSNLVKRTEVPISVADSPETCVIRGLMQASSGKKRNTYAEWMRTSFLEDGAMSFLQRNGKRSKQVAGKSEISES